jgi:hypothetical protein
MGKNNTTTDTLTSLLCCPCRCLFCGLLSCILSVLASLLITAGLVALALYLLFRPHVIQATVDAADLATFTMEPRTWILRYNLTVDVHLRNPNKRIAIDYRAVQARAFYQGQHFDRHVDLPDFFQDAGETALLAPQFLGHIPLVGGAAAAGFRREAAENATFTIHVEIESRTKLKVWVLTLPGPSPKIDCTLRIRRRRRDDTGELPPGSFHPTQCRVSFFC